MTERLDGTVALVTGASSGIGEAAALALARQGATVALVARRTDRLESLAEKIRDLGGNALSLRADVTDEHQARDAVERTVAGREARSGSWVYNATKHGVGAFSEALRKEVTGRHVRVSLVEPGAVETELAGHNRPEILERIRQRRADVEILQPEDIAETVTHIVTRPRHVAVNELLVRPTEQEG